MPAKKKNYAATPVDSLKHKKEKRMNIPTKELRGFVEEDEKSPKKILYPRDPSLDPQLVWKGKDEQDRKALEVPAVPVYIQEKIHPQAIIEDLRKTKGKESFTPSLFADFNGIKFEEMIEFYRHEQNWSNRMILGDSLLVMTSLSEKEGLKGKVQTIYIDPPYGIKFGSNWQVSTRKKEVKDGKAEDTSREPEVVKAFRDTWNLGIHSYLAYLRDRLVVARALLTETGSVFVQINSENSHLMRNLLDEVFGSENFIADIYFRKKSIPLGAKYLETMHDQILFYAKDAEHVKFRHLYEEMDSSMLSSHGPYALYPDGKNEKIKIEDVFNSAHPVGTRYYRLFSLLAPSFSESTVYTFKYDDRIFSSPSRGSWVVSKEKLEILAKIGRLQPEGSNLSYRLFYDDFPYRKRTNTWADAPVSYEKSYVVQTSPEVIARCLLMATDPGDLVLDPTCGSGTTAYIAEQRGRRWITIDTSRVSIALARTRLMAARFPYYLLDDSIEGAKKEAEITGKLPPDRRYEGDIKKGFVYKRVSHVTLKSIANNTEIDEIHNRWKKKMEPIREKLNRLRKAKWEEWEIPREAEKDWPKEAKSAHEDWWKLRQERQQEIDASIARKADTERLYDQPYEDKRKIRVTGPFTVESLSPHRMLVADVEKPAGEAEARDGDNRGQFVTMIVENLKTAGVQNTKKKERLKFSRLEPHAGTWVHAVGEYMEGDKSRSVGVFIGPEHGTVGPEMVREAAKEAVLGIGFDTLIACGFAFDPHVSEESTRFGKLTVLVARMNPDLAMGQELLKKTGAGNLFMVFGEPDVDIKKMKDGKLVAEIKGLDVYDPTTGVIRSNSTDDIACWFIDTDYNGESFFVRHAYFTGGDEPYEKLKRALKAEIDEAAWRSIYATKSRPFDVPKSKKIAVKVINHYGDEVLKVYPA
ncbi:MAG: site-specific DNA-methyltransferase [Desulfomonile tiedjei]|nr:site-specific DNA-methyltransferase [Desulfomonile tiedjei]